MDGYKGRQEYLPGFEPETPKPVSDLESQLGLKPNQEDIPDSLKYDPPSNPKKTPYLSQEVVPDTLEIQINEEDPEKVAKKIVRTKRLMEQWVLYSDPVGGEAGKRGFNPEIIEKVAEMRGFDPILNMNIKARYFQEQIDHVVWCEAMLEGMYIPIGAAYRNSREGLLVLHQEIDSKKNKLGDTFYLTRRFFVGERPNGSSVYRITNTKFALDEEGEMDEEKDKDKDKENETIAAISTSSRNGNLTLFFLELPHEFHNKIKEFMEKPSCQLLVDAKSYITKENVIAKDKLSWEMDKAFLNRYRRLGVII